MATVILDHVLSEQLKQERAESGADRWDEVWEGTYMVAPLPNNEHQDLVGGFVDVFREVLGKLAHVYPGANVSDRENGWLENYRSPDVAIFFTNTTAKNCGTHWCGGPDFAVEIISDDDRTRDKIPFYGKVRTRELLVVDRDPWRLELWRLDRDTLKQVGSSDARSENVLPNEVLPLMFRLVSGDADRPAIKVTRPSDGRTWDV